MRTLRFMRPSRDGHRHSTSEYVRKPVPRLAVAAGVIAAVLAVSAPGYTQGMPNGSTVQQPQTAATTQRVQTNTVQPPKTAPVRAISALMNECPTRVRTGSPPASRTISGTACDVIRLWMIGDPGHGAARPDQAHAAAHRRRPYGRQGNQTSNPRQGRNAPPRSGAACACLGTKLRLRLHSNRCGRSAEARLRAPVLSARRDDHSCSPPASARRRRPDDQGGQARERVRQPLNSAPLASCPRG